METDTELGRSVLVLGARFGKPGETLRVAMWKEGNRIHFETTAVESNQKVITGPFADLHETELGKSHEGNQGISLLPVSSPQLKSDEVFNTMIDRLKAKPELVKKINGVFLYKITSGGQEVARWTSDLKRGKIYRGDPESGVKVDTTLTLDDKDMLDMATGKLNPQAAFMKGKLKIQGNIMLAQKLKDIQSAESKI